MNRYGAIFVTAMMVFLVHCGYYSFSGSLPPHLKTVAIPLFDNRTAEFGIAEEMTDTIIDEFTRDGSLKITDQGSADVLIEGSIIRIEDRAGGFSQDEQVQDFNVYVTVRVKCTDQVKRTVMWEERLTQFGTYDPAEGAQGRSDAIAEAMDKFSEQILNNTVSGW